MRLILGGFAGVSAAILGIPLNLVMVAYVTAALLWYVPTSYRHLWHRPAFWCVVVALTAAHAVLMRGVLLSPFRQSLVSTILILAAELFVAFLVIEEFFGSSGADAARASNGE
jgi:hypothetical protein